MQADNVTSPGMPGFGELEISLRLRKSCKRSYRISELVIVVGVSHKSKPYVARRRLGARGATSVSESKHDDNVGHLRLVKFQGARSGVTPVPKVHDLGGTDP
jgi:hypothetical protein